MRKVQKLFPLKFVVIVIHVLMRSYLQETEIVRLTEQDATGVHTVDWRNVLPSAWTDTVR